MHNLKDILYKVSAILVLLSAVLYLFAPEIAPWGMAIGTLGLTVATAMMRYPGKSIRGKRLFNFQIFSCIFFLMATYLMFKQNLQWALSMAVGSILLLYAAIMLPIVYEKEKSETKE